MLKEILVLIQNATISLPVTELTVLVFVLSLCLLFRFNKTGLMTSYIFAYRWGWIFFAGHDEKYLFLYLLWGVLVGIITVIGMIRQPGSN